MSAMPNAGLPTRVEGRNMYLCSPEYMAQYARRHAVGRRPIIGGCCGTTPRTHQADPLGDAVAAAAAKEGSASRWEEPEAKAHALTRFRWRRKSKLGAKLTQGKFVAFVEILPPRGVDASREIAGARLCAEHGIDAINVPDGPRAKRAHERASRPASSFSGTPGIEAVSHFCCRDRNILGIHRSCWPRTPWGCATSICITGDPPRHGLYPDATAVFDVDAIGLVNIVNNLNHGLDIGGNPIGSQPPC